MDNNKLERLSLFDNSLGLDSNENLNILYNGINYNKNLKYLDLGNNGFNTYNKNFGHMIKLKGLKVNLNSNNFNKEKKKNLKE